MSRWGKFQDVADLPVNAFSESKFTRTYEGGGGGTSTSYSTNLPEYAKPFYEDMMKRTQEESLKGYTPYEGERIAGFQPGQQMAAEQLLGMAVPSEALAGAGATFDTVAQRGLTDVYQPGADFDSFSYTPTTVTSEYDPSRLVSSYTAGQREMGYDPSRYQVGYQAEDVSPTYRARSFADEGVAEQYMTPYMRQVLDVQKREAGKEYQAQRAAGAAEAIRAGAFGGGREGAQRAIAESEYLDRMAQIEATGMQQAYEQAAKQFGLEEGLLQTESSQGLTAAQLEAQGYQTQGAQDIQRYSAAEQARQAQEAAQLAGYQASQQALQQAEQLGLSSFQANEAARQAQAQAEAQAYTASEQAAQQAEQFRQSAYTASEQAMQQAEQFRQSAAQMTMQDAQFAANKAMEVLTNKESQAQFAANYGQQGLQIAQQAGLAQQGLAESQQRMEIAKSNAEMAIGDKQQAQAQAELDQAYADFVNARDYERQQLAFLNAIMRGIPVPVQQETITSGGNPLAQVAGTGLAALGAFGGMGQS